MQECYRIYDLEMKLKMQHYTCINMAIVWCFYVSSDFFLLIYTHYTNDFPCKDDIEINKIINNIY